MKPTKKFIKKFNEYLSLYEKGYTFSGQNLTEKYNKFNDINGVSAIESAFSYESFGKLLPCSEFDKLIQFLSAKASINLHIEMYANDFGKTLFYNELVEMDLPKWVVKAVENKAKQRV